MQNFNVFFVSKILLFFVEYIFIFFYILCFNYCFWLYRKRVVVLISLLAQNKDWMSRCCWTMKKTSLIHNTFQNILVKSRKILGKDKMTEIFESSLSVILKKVTQKFFNQNINNLNLNYKSNIFNNCFKQKT